MGEIEGAGGLKGSAQKVFLKKEWRIEGLAGWEGDEIAILGLKTFNLFLWSRPKAQR
jgi:hypothetical protein